MKKNIKKVIIIVSVIIIIYGLLVLLTQLRIFQLAKIISEKRYKHNMKKNYDNSKTKDKTIVFCSTIRNLDEKLEKNMNFLIHIGKTYFKDFSIVLFENDSEDKTRGISTKIYK